MTVTPLLIVLFVQLFLRYNSPEMTETELFTEYFTVHFCTIIVCCALMFVNELFGESCGE